MREFLRDLAYAVYDYVNDCGIRVFEDLGEDALYVHQNYYSSDIEDSKELERIADAVFFGEWDDVSKAIGRYLLVFGVDLRKFNI